MALNFVNVSNLIKVRKFYFLPFFKGENVCTQQNKI